MQMREGMSMRVIRSRSCALNAATAFLAAIIIGSTSGCGGGGGGYGGGSNNPPPPPPPPAAPTITLEPLAFTTVNRTVPLTATVNAPAGVSRVEFLVDGAAIATVTTSPYETDWDTSAVSDGAHTVAARVTDTSSVAVTTPAVTVTVSNRPVIPVTLSPAQTLPNPASSASGSGELTFNLIDGSVTGGVTIAGIAATMAHIHDGFAGATGPVIVNFVQSSSDPNRWDAQAGAMLTAEQIDGLLAGRLYVNVHSAAYPAGEIRGQIKPDNVLVVFTTMSGTEVVPAVSTTATGIAATTMDSSAGTATVNIVSSGVDDATEAHVHKAASGATGAANLFALAKDPVALGNWSAQLEPVTAADRSDFDANGWYVDLHTPANTGGELRGQITPNPAPPPPPPPPTVTLAQLQSTIFTPRCSGCHNGTGSSLPGVMDLSSANLTFSSLVDTPSIQQPARRRVAPNDAENSYVIHKLEGASSITGGRMPAGGPFLDQATIDQVKEWINAGALNN